MRQITPRSKLSPLARRYAASKAAGCTDWQDLQRQRSRAARKRSQERMNDDVLILVLKSLV